MLILSKRILLKEKKKKKEFFFNYNFIVVCDSIFVSQSGIINSVANSVQSTKKFNRFEESLKRMNIFSKILESRPRRKKRERKHRVKNETRTIFSPSSSLSLSLFLVPVFIPIREKNLAQFLIRQRNYSSEKVFDARYTNQARKLGALAMHDISLDRILDRWSLVGTDVAWRSPLPDGETWVSGWTATCETWKEEETMRNRESRTAELRRSLTRNLNYSLRENVSTSIVSSNTRRSFATIPLCDIFHPLLHRTKKEV